MECMNCNFQTIDENDYNAMLKWFDENDIQPSITPQTGEEVNCSLVQQWIEFSSSKEQQELAQEFL